MAAYFSFEVTPGQAVQEKSLREQTEGSGGGGTSKRNGGMDSTSVTEKVKQWMSNVFSEEGNLRLWSPIAGCDEREAGEEETGGRIARRRRRRMKEEWRRVGTKVIREEKV